MYFSFFFFFFQAEDGIRDKLVTGVQTCALPISLDELMARRAWSLLREMRDADPVGYREMFSNFIPLNAPPSEVYSDRQLEVIYGAVCRGLARRAARIATRLH